MATSIRLPYQFNGRKITSETVSVFELKKADGAQRDLNQARVKKMAEGFEYFAMGTVTASRRIDGDLYLVDGQHRVAALKMVLESLRSRASAAETAAEEAELNNDSEAADLLRMDATDLEEQYANKQKVLVEVHHDLSARDEATLFLIKNRESSKPNAVDQFIVGENAGLPLYKATADVLKAHGLHVKKEIDGVKVKAGDRVGSVTPLLETVENYGPETLDLALQVAERMWGGPNRVAKTWDGGLVGGLGMLFGEHKGQVDVEEVVDAMNNVPKPKSLATTPSDPTVWVNEMVIKAQSASGYTGSTMSRVKAAYSEVFLKVVNARRPKGSKLASQL